METQTERMSNTSEEDNKLEYADISSEEQEQERAHLKKVKLENNGKGSLLLTDTKLEFVRKKNFFKSPQLELSVALSDLHATEVDKENNILIIEWRQENNGTGTARLELPKGSDSDQFCNALHDSLEQIRLEAYQKEQSHHYKKYLWRTAYFSWMLSKYLQFIMYDLSQENWDNIDANIKQLNDIVDHLTSDCGIEIDAQFNSLNETLSLRDSSSAFKTIISVLETCGSAFKEQVIPWDKWGEISSIDVSLPKWEDIGFIYLFSGQYHLLSLLQYLNKTEAIEETMSRLVFLQSIVNLLMHPELQEDVLVNEFGEHEECEYEETAFSQADFRIDNTSTNIDDFAQATEDLLKQNAGIL